MLKIGRVYDIAINKVISKWGLLITIITAIRYQQ